MGLPSLLIVALTAALAAGEQVFEDSPALTALWQATSSGSTEAFINQIIQNQEYAQHRAADGRGPLFWAYEFKNVDTFALLHHLGVTSEQQEDVDGKGPKEFFTGTAEELTEFVSTHATCGLGLPGTHSFCMPFSRAHSATSTLMFAGERRQGEGCGAGCPPQGA
jgi:hypothetical protein